MDNCIYDDENNITIGFRKDLQGGLKKIIEDYIKDNNWEEVSELVDVLIELNEMTDNNNLLVLSDNNGMGYTIKEYEKGE